jgi:hypothetical protein
MNQQKQEASPKGAEKKDYPAAMKKDQNNKVLEQETDETEESIEEQELQNNQQKKQNKQYGQDKKQQNPANPDREQQQHDDPRRREDVFQQRDPQKDQDWNRRR